LLYVDLEKAMILNITAVVPNCDDDDDDDYDGDDDNDDDVVVDFNNSDIDNRFAQAAKMREQTEG